jgi:hypothetical protein
MMPSPTEPGPLGELPTEATYTDLPTLKAALQNYAQVNGFAISVATSRPNRTIYKCSKTGNYDSRNKHTAANMDQSKLRKHTGSIKTNCPFRVTGKLDSGGWNLCITNGNHNHDAVTHLSALLQFRTGQLSKEQMDRIIELSRAGCLASSILVPLEKDNPNLVPRDIYNILAGIRKKELGTKTPTEWPLNVRLIINLILF